MKIDEYPMSEKTKDLELIIPRFLNLVEEYALESIQDGDLGGLAELEVFLVDSIDQLSAYKEKMQNSRKVLKTEAAKNEANLLVLTSLLDVIPKLTSTTKILC